MQPSHLQPSVPLPRCLKGNTRHRSSLRSQLLFFFPFFSLKLTRSTALAAAERELRLAYSSLKVERRSGLCGVFIIITQLGVIRRFYRR